MKTLIDHILAWLKEHYGVLILFALLAGIIMYLLLKAPVTQTGGVIIKHDTTVITRYEEGQTDTIVKWYERLIYVHPPSETVYVQKVDSAFIEITRYKDVMLQVKKSKDRLQIFALNEKDSVLKEYNFDGVYNNFTATSAYKNIYVSSSAFEWTGVNLSVAYLPRLSFQHALSWNPAPTGNHDSLSIPLELSTGITYKNRLTLSALMQYDINNPAPYVGLKLTYKLIK